jgi:hypothetical protein
VPERLSSLFWSHQKVTDDLLMKTAWKTIDNEGKDVMQPMPGGVFL